MDRKSNLVYSEGIQINEDYDYISTQSNNEIKGNNITMKFTTTKTVSEPYTLHQCPNCKRIKSDNYVLEDKDYRLPELEHFYVLHDENLNTWTIE